jgi:hypothetical protein
MASMDEEPAPHTAPEEGRPEPGERPTRRLERPPGERYEVRVGGEADAKPTSSILGDTAPAKGAVFATLVGIVGAALDVVLAGALAVSSGLLVTAALIGRFVGLGIRVGAGSTISPGLARSLGLVLAVAAILLAQVGIWLYARSEGGALELADYLAQTFGWLVPVELAIAGIVGWLSAA